MQFLIRPALGEVTHHMLTMPGMKKIGYACVSTEDQTVALQFDALRSAGWAEFWTSREGESTWFNAIWTDLSR
jgi:hypothetical protein